MNGAVLSLRKSLLKRRCLSLPHLRSHIQLHYQVPLLVLFTVWFCGGFIQIRFHRGASIAQCLKFLLIVLDTRDVNPSEREMLSLTCNNASVSVEALNSSFFNKSIFCCHFGCNYCKALISSDRLIIK